MLNLAMTKVGLSELKFEDICPKEYPFGLSNEPINTICAVRIPFVYNIFHGKDAVSFHVRFDVIGGHSSFLIDLLSFLAMQGSLKFHFCNLFITFHRIVYCIQFLETSAHLELPQSATSRINVCFAISAIPATIPGLVATQLSMALSNVSPRTITSCLLPTQIYFHPVTLSSIHIRASRKFSHSLAMSPQLK